MAAVPTGGRPRARPPNWSTAGSRLCLGNVPVPVLDTGGGGWQDGILLLDLTRIFKLPARFRPSEAPAVPVPKWRNWQTRYIQGVVPVRVWRFESSLRHFQLSFRNRSCPANCSGHPPRCSKTVVRPPGGRAYIGVRW